MRTQSSKNITGLWPNDEIEKNHWTERGRATAIAHADAFGRPRRSVLAFGDIMTRTLILSLVCLLIGCSRSVLPSERALLELEDAKLREMVLQHAPLGTGRQAIEQTFSRSFQKKFTVVAFESAEVVSKRGFSVPVVTGDYYLRSDVASKMSGLGTCRVVTVFLLFDSAGRLKDVAVSKWTDSI